MTIIAVDHIAINTVNIEESIRFYSQVMGFELVKRVPNGENNLVYLKINGNSTLELFDWDKEIQYNEHPNNSSGTAHIALSVSGISEWYEHLKTHNVEFTLPLCALNHLGKNVLLFKDPNGVVIELSEDL